MLLFLGGFIAGSIIGMGICYFISIISNPDTQYGNENGEDEEEF